MPVKFPPGPETCIPRKGVASVVPRIQAVRQYVAPAATGIPLRVTTRPPENETVSRWNRSQAEASLTSVTGPKSTACQAPVPDSQVSVNTADWHAGTQASPQAPQLPRSVLRSSSQP